MKSGLLVFFTMCLLLTAHGQLVEELQVSYSDGSMDTFTFIPGNVDRVPWFNIQNSQVELVVDKNGSSLACDSVVSDLSGKIALFDRGECLLSDKFDFVAAANPIGFLMCNGESGDPPVLGGFGSSNLPMGAMWKSDCDSIKLKLDAITSVNWVSQYFLDCSDTIVSPPSLCDEAFDLGLISDCPDLMNSALLETGTRCPDNPQPNNCFADTLGSIWIKWTTGDDMTRLNIQLIGIQGNNPFLEIFDGGDCSAMGEKITCLQGDSVFLVENLDPNTTYYGLLGE